MPPERRPPKKAPVVPPLGDPPTYKTLRRLLSLARNEDTRPLIARQHGAALVAFVHAATVPTAELTRSLRLLEELVEDNNNRATLAGQRAVRGLLRQLSYHRDTEVRQRVLDVLVYLVDNPVAARQAAADAGAVAALIKPGRQPTELREAALSVLRMLSMEDVHAARLAREHDAVAHALALIGGCERRAVRLQALGLLQNLLASDGVDTPLSDADLRAVGANLRADLSFREFASGILMELSTTQPEALLRVGAVEWLRAALNTAPGGDDDPDEVVAAGLSCALALSRLLLRDGDSDGDGGLAAAVEESGFPLATHLAGALRSITTGAEYVGSVWIENEQHTLTGIVHNLTRRCPTLRPALRAALPRALLAELVVLAVAPLGVRPAAAGARLAQRLRDLSDSLHGTPA